VIGKLSVNGTIRGAGIADRLRIRSTGDTAGVQAGGIEHADFLAGIADNGKDHADDPGDFLADLAMIKTVKVKGIKGQAGPFFADTTFSAASIGRVSLTAGDFATGESGLFALDQGTGKEIKSVKYADKATGEKWQWPIKKGVFTGPADLINLL